MTTPLKITGLKRQAARFVRADDGSILPMFGFTLLMLLSLVGAAVDYARVNNARTAMQAALDSAALMISKDAAMANPPMSAGDIQTKAEAYFKVLYTNSYAPKISFTATYTPPSSGSTSTVKLEATGTMPTEIMKVAGFSKIDFAIASTATWGSARLRVALALDNTGSMSSDNKLPSLKDAAKTLINQLSGLSQNAGDVYISLIPFATNVKVGKSFKTSGYIDWSNWSTSGSVLDLPGYPRNEIRRSCERNATYPMQCGTAYNDIDNWNGCVMDRTQPNDISNTPPSSAATNFPADQSSSCPTQKVIALTDTKTSLSTLTGAVDKMTAQGATNQAIGLAWAWHSLMQGAPLNAPAEDSNYEYSKVIILMSDGLNTEDRWYGNGRDTEPQVDTRQALLCQAIKDVKDPQTLQSVYTIYTIQVNTGQPADPESKVLKGCATDTGKFYTVTSSNKLTETFLAIGNELTKLRIAK